MIFVLGNPVVPPLGMNMVLRVKNFYMPLSMYIINDNNRTLIIEPVGAPGHSTTYLLPKGNYNASNLIPELETLLGVGYSVSFSTITNKYTFTKSSGEFTIQGTSTCLNLLGFEAGVSSTSVASVLISTFPVDFSGESTIYIDIPNLKTFNVSSRTTIQSSIVKSILIDVPYGSLLYYENPVSSTGSIIQEDNISFVHVQLLGQDEETLINLENGNWQMTLEISFVEKQVQPTITTMRDVYKNYIESLIKQNGVQER